VTATMDFKRLCSLGIDDHTLRLIVWWGCACSSAVLTVVAGWLGVIPFLLLIVAVMVRLVKKS